MDILKSNAVGNRGGSSTSIIKLNPTISTEGITGTLSDSELSLLESPTTICVWTNSGVDIIFRQQFTGESGAYCLSNIAEGDASEMAKMTFDLMIDKDNKSYFIIMNQPSPKNQTLTQDEYDALTDAEKNNGDYYFIVEE